MARTTYEIPLQNPNIDEAINMVSNILFGYGYQNKIVNGENIWVKGDGVIVKMSCFGFYFTENALILQGWMKDALTGESDLNGFVAALPKKKMKRIMDEIGQVLSGGYRGW